MAVSSPITHISALQKKRRNQVPGFQAASPAFEPNSVTQTTEDDNADQRGTSPARSAYSAFQLCNGRHVKFSYQAYQMKTKPILPVLGKNSQV
jgi:hypothetical protein